MDLRLSKLNRGPHLPALVASSISREIAQGRLKPGDQLPSEQALAVTFGVSRNVVREAIAILRSEGHVWSKQGRGAFVADKTNVLVLTIKRDTPHAGAAFEGLFELREIIEAEAAGLAAERRSDDDLADMEQALETMTGVPYGCVQWLKADLQFHLAIAQATGNPYMTEFLKFISEPFQESILAAGNENEGSDEMARVTIGEHKAVLDAIETGDAAAAHEAMSLHIANASRRQGHPMDAREAPPKVSASRKQKPKKQPTLRQTAD